MLIRNATAYIDGGFCAGIDLRLMHGKVQEIGSGLLKGLYEEEVDLAGDYLLPGFVDVHIHAFRGHDAMQGEDAVRQMARDLHREGVAAFLPTTMSAPMDDTRRAIDGIRAVKRRPDAHAALVLGAHMEAPYLNADKRGAQRREFLHAPDMAEFMSMIGGRTEDVRIVTLAPELPGAEAFIREITARGVVVSVGHTAATAEQTHLAADWGATHVTHTFNAQPALHHRSPGVPGAALTDDRLYAECIADGIHLHPDILRLMLRAKGAERLVAVTDAMEAAGMPDGQYALGGQTVLVHGGEARLRDGTLAGSVLTMRQALHNLIHRFGFRPEDAVRMTTQTPAESIGEPLLGRLTVGLPAPLTRWDRDWNMVSVLS
ncbi:MAG: N-acetylglucosamine-6-phosphate deacetylase [Christensenellaceae bacterium]|nr:N-acetylglucosamine-6-phosphate deacetylase [Christensenellaceae bacterium]